MESTILFILIMVTFGAVLAGAIYDLRNTRRAILRDERSSEIDPSLGPRTEGFNMTSPR